MFLRLLVLNIGLWLGLGIACADDARPVPQHPVTKLDGEQGLRFRVGEALFERLWVSAPASTQSADGLGPHYNARACGQCHPDNGRGHPTRADTASQAAVSLVLRLSNKGQPDPIYGLQLQPFAVSDLEAEGQLWIDYHDVPVTLSDGETVALRHPRYVVLGLPDGALAPDTRFSPRLAPAVAGLGLLEAIADQDIAAHADPMDRDHDGISGRTITVWSPTLKRQAPGRFGWKSEQARLADQVETAFNHDLGLSTTLYPDPFGDCTVAQIDCRSAATGNSPRFDDLEAPPSVTVEVTHFLQHLAAPGRRNHNDPAVQRGERQFHDLGCAGCHRPHWRTGLHPDKPALSEQDLYPYTDMLLHDMGDELGDGQLAGDDPNAMPGSATGNEWRTPPLWAMGITDTNSNKAFYLHDGRARNLLEAVLWHGGEAQISRDRVVQLGADARADLIRFLESL
ncbi:MAG: thiol oxidoreductase [Gammaproteobacteria bacterium]|nr:thiol oxidoreductase [Gammaproteobacteria bacterium]